MRSCCGATNIRLMIRWNGIGIGTGMGNDIGVVLAQKPKNKPARGWLMVSGGEGAGP